MNRKLLAVVGIVVAAGGVGAYALAGRGGPAHPHAASSGESEHAAGIDQAMGAVRAEYLAAPGATPCESAYNAFKASLDFSTQEHVDPVVLRLAPHDEFIQQCSTLPEATQKCLAPHYMVLHRPECEKAKPAASAITPMITLRPPAQEGPPTRYEPGQTLPPPSPPSP
jgi:hypothetical protein